MMRMYDVRAATMVWFGLFSTFYDLISNLRHVDVEQQIVGFAVRIKIILFNRRFG